MILARRKAAARVRRLEAQRAVCLGSNAAAGDGDAERCLWCPLIADLHGMLAGRLVAAYLRGERMRP